MHLRSSRPTFVSRRSTALLLCAPLAAALTLALSLVLGPWPAVAPEPALAAPDVALTFTVNSPADIPDAHPGDGACETAQGNNVCTLRAALQEANAHPGSDTIKLQPNITYLLTSVGINAALDITDSVTILGAGPRSTVIDGNGVALGRRVFQITGTVVISGVTIQHGQSSNFGGGLISNGRLTLRNSAVLSNTVSGINDWGGGIYSSGALTLSNSVVSGNVGGNHNPYGGGIYNQGPLLIISSTLSNNTSGGVGGGLYSAGYTTTVIASTISGNSAQNGGGIYKSGFPVFVINSTVSGNSSAVNGGGLYVSSGTAGLYNVSMTRNRANADGIGSGTGGGVYNATGSTLSFDNSIIALNENVIVTGQGQILNNDDCAGIITSQGYSILHSIDGSYCTVSGPYLLADPQLEFALKDNGGPTWTHALLPGSPAIDGGNPGGCTDNLGAILHTDQRGQKRPALGGFGACDIGAFEYAWRLYLPLLRK